MPRKLLVVLTGILIAVLAGTLGAAALLRAPDKSEDVTLLDGTRMVAREYDLLSGRLEAQVISDFPSAAGGVDAGFWDTESGGRTPRQELQNRVEHDYATTVLLFRLGNDNGLLGFRDFPGFFADLQAENKRRADAQAAGQVVYGPQQYSQQAYFEYLIGGLRQELAGQFTESGLTSYLNDHLAELTPAAGARWGD